MVSVSKSKLGFNKAIISTVDNLIQTDELLNRLIALHQELSILEQGKVDLSTLDRYRNDLNNRKLLKHKDNGVKAFVACCLSDILRLYAPDAPYTESQLVEIFRLILSQFELLGNPDNGYYIQQTYLITRMLEYRSIVLVTDLPNSDKLLEDLFKIFYDDSRAFQPKLFKVIAGILGEVISEFDTVPTPVLKLIFNKFLTHNPEDVPDGLEVAPNCGYNVSLILCDAYSSRMSRHLTKYYSEVLYHVTNEESNNAYEIRWSASRTIEKLHKLVFRLWQTSPDLTSAVIGFVYHELSADNEMMRKQATKLVGQLLTVTSSLNFAVTHRESYNAWLSKIADVSADVRLQWTCSLSAILATRDDIAPDLNKGLTKTLIDSEYSVRKASVAVISELSIANVWKTIIDPTVYECLLPLTREKNREVRELCISTVADLYSDSVETIERTAENVRIWEIIDTIPSVLFNLYYINDRHISEQVDRVLFKSLLPLEADDRKRVQRLLKVVAHLDGKALTSFFAFNKRQMQIALALSKLVDFCALPNDNESKLQKTIAWLASGFSDRLKASAALEALKEINDKRIFYLIKSCITNDVSFVTLKNSMDELLVKIRDPGLFRKNNVRSMSTIMPKDIATQVEILLYRSAPIIYNFSSIPILLDTGASTGQDDLVWKRKLLDEISKVNPALFKDHVKTLKNIVENEHYLASGQESLTLSEALKTVYKISKTLSDQVNLEDTTFFCKLKTLALEGDPITSKYAVKLIALSPFAQEKFREIKSDILPLDKKHNRFASHILVLAEIYKFCPHVLDKDSTEIVSFLIQEVLLANQVVGDSNEEDKWIEDADLTTSKYLPLSAKLYALKLFTSKLKSISSEGFTDELTAAFTEKTVKLFFYLIASGGELIPESNEENYPTPSNYQTKLRSYAGLQALKLSCIPFFNDFIKPANITTLINLVEDESLPVRKEFLDSLKNCISRQAISIKFLPLVFFTAYEPNEDLKTSTKTWVNYTFGKESFRKNTTFERALPRLISAIAHHPDIVEGFDSEDESYLEGLTIVIDYLVFYFDSIAIQENFSMLYYLSERVKNYKDVIAEENDSEAANQSKNSTISSTRIYIIGEIAQMILLAIKDRKGWQHSAYPGKLNLPADLFAPFGTIEEAQASFKTYLPEKYTERLQMNIKAKVARLLHTSQTQKQKLQKRMLNNEYQEVAKKKKKQKRHAVSNRAIDEDSDSEANQAFTVAGKDNNGTVSPLSKKSLRTRKKVDYRDDDNSESENELD
ncbi:hypothetical protein HG536_0A04670 [Torulaspora globosa]|uniref:Sister chromatid cohesion protein PDS5 n=1 Tax=Torulaspora globosa TaxID=48254 RepID=A0A7G3ZAW5_9SACH|nr:uncharacterized protein HG536_0A04670 [Torulaspora globosa]QLL30651.1 hypothetical protein HG536_0A04670 [Torulaspora globosa]